MQISDVEVGQIIKGTIKNLTNSGLFVAISSNIDGVIWPNHYADIALKHPERRFKPGARIKCRVCANICSLLLISYPALGFGRRPRTQAHIIDS